MGIRPQDDWFMTGDDPTLAARDVQVFCFAHAGGDPVSYLRWQRQLAGSAQLLAVIPPGRGHRTQQQAIGDVERLADGAAAAIERAGGRRTILFGHSLGGLLAFEVARRLRGNADVTDLIASGCAAPSGMPSSRVLAASRLQGRDFAEAVAFFGGLPPEVVAAEELYALLLPRLTADFLMVAGYRYRREAPLTIPIQLVNGEQDPHVHAAGLTGWAAESVIAPQHHHARGGHFYFEQDPTALLEVLAARAAFGSLGDHDQHVELI